MQVICGETGTMMHILARLLSAREDTDEAMMRSLEYCPTFLIAETEKTSSSNETNAFPIGRDETSILQEDQEASAVVIMGDEGGCGKETSFFLGCENLPET